jgi:hypothetical protein
MEGSRFCMHCGSPVTVTGTKEKTVLEDLEATVLESSGDRYEKPLPPSARPAPPEERPAIPPERPKPVYQAETEVKPSPPVPVERPKATEEERRRAQPVERSEPGAKMEMEASLKGPEERAPSLMGDLISQGPQLLSENRHLRILEQVQKLTWEERQNINIKVLECFAHLKRFVVDRDKQSKPFWSQLYQFLDKSNNRNATSLLIKITKDPEDYTRLYAVTLLGSIGDREPSPICSKSQTPTPIEKSEGVQPGLLP